VTVTLFVTDLTATGTAGTARRLVHTGALEGLGRIVSAWELAPADGTARTCMVMVDTGADLVLILTRVDHAAMSAYRSHNLPELLGVDVATVIAVHLASDEACRELLRHLARSAVAGDLPIAVATPTDQAVWLVAATTVASLLLHPIGG